ncbi:MAG: alpha/beta hydrolase [Phenylobacterium sp.]|uniref:alpha/beta fold hydrolase n=1 Tax=Phenylobacterium sp. TaxID=1871053 RepID=UPI001A52B2CB|nr:alpha/beta hydrolase [Phenylobacterium sp.]MBL8553106.1 alpha/beta hydrolase [Phenylobacterium sp.]
MNALSPTLELLRVASGDVEIAADVAGAADGAPVILLHGGGQTRGAWGGALAEGARRGFRMISADLRGHGESGWSPGADYGMAAHAGDIRALADALDAPPFLVGASLGGMASLSYAALGHPLAGLVMVDIAPTVNTAGTDKILAFMHSAPDGFASVDEAADAVAAYLPHRKRPKDTSGLLRNLRLRDGRYYWHWDPRMFGERDRPRRDTEGLRDAARGLRAPTLLVRGRLSDVLSQEGVDDFLQLVPHAEFADIADADHMVAGDRNDAFNDAVFAFLDRHAGR